MRFCLKILFEQTFPQTDWSQTVVVNISMFLTRLIEWGFRGVLGCFFFHEEEILQLRG